MIRRVSIAVVLGGFLACGPAAGQDSFGGMTDPQPGPQQAAPAQQSPPEPTPDQAPQQQSPQATRSPQQLPQQGSTPDPDFSDAAQIENQDFGVAPIRSLHAGAMHGPTPTSIPGGSLITTEALWSALQQNPRSIVIFDVLGGPEVIPGAYAAAPAATPGSFNDPTQQQFGQFLQSVTGGDQKLPLLFYCLSPQCWMSYNAALRAINMGYSRVWWYRGGIEAWKLAGLPTRDSNAGGRGQR